MPDKDNKVEDTKAAGPKSKDSTREGKIEENVNREGANRDLEDRRAGLLHGDNTSSTGGANNPGQHGRDGGAINNQTNNPAPTDDVVENEEGQRIVEALEEEKEDYSKDKEMKKL